MPITGILFIAGSIAIAGLPFFNGFISELMIYLSSIFGIVNTSNIVLAFLSVFTGASLALIGGLAVACFTKVIGISFLGNERTTFTPSVSEVPGAMLLGMILLAIVCAGIGMGSYFIVPILINPVKIMTGNINPENIDVMMNTTRIVTITLFSVLGLGVIISFFRKIITKKHRIADKVETWGCGYSSPKASMQYTASSFAEPITDYFSIPLDISKKENIDTSFFPKNKWKFHSTANDWMLTKIFEPFILLMGKIFTSLKWLQNGKSGFYVLYIAIAILSLIVWKFFL